eukprot:scaffold271652_cov67-Attheya_sp.AAC.3
MMMYLAIPSIVPLLIGSSCPAAFHTVVALGNKIMAMPPRACPLLGVGGFWLFFSPPVVGPSSGARTVWSGGAWFERVSPLSSPLFITLFVRLAWVIGWFNGLPFHTRPYGFLSTEIDP